MLSGNEVLSLIGSKFYAYDEETIETLKEIFLCKKQELRQDRETLLKLKEMNEL